MPKSEQKLTRRSKISSYWRHIFEILMYSKENPSRSKSHHFLAITKRGPLPLPYGFHYSSPSPSLQGSLSNSSSLVELAPEKAPALTIIKRGPTMNLHLLVTFQEIFPNLEITHSQHLVGRCIKHESSKSWIHHMDDIQNYNAIALIGWRLK